MVELSSSYGLTLLPWQENTLEAVMGERRDGLWAAKHIGLSVPRQNGKGSVLEARALAGLLLFDEQMIIHSAHEVRTAQIGFQRLKSYFENYDDLRKKVVSIGNAVAREYIRLRNGQEVRFVTRSKSAIRGFSADCLLLDEGQILGDMQWEAILYTVSARPKHQIWLVGTPPLSVDEGVVFHRFRNRGLEGKDHQLAWLEWSAVDDADLDDPKAWAAANPALGSMITHETVVTERAAASDEGFARERLGMWTDGTGAPAVDFARWVRLANPAMPPPPRVVLTVDVSPALLGESEERRPASIGYAGDADGKTMVGCKTDRGVDWVVAEVQRLCDTKDVAEVALCTYGQAKMLEPAFVEAGIDYVRVTQTDMGAAVGHMQELVKTGQLIHGGQPELDAAVASAKVRMVGENEVWDRREPTVNISPLVACSGAAYRLGMIAAPLPAIY